MKQRKRIPLKEKLAAALYELASRDYFVPWRALELSADFVIAQFDFHHEVFYAHGGTDDWHNLTPMLHTAHREKTKRDLATIAKGKRIQRKQNEHQARMEAKYAGTEDSGSDGARNAKAERGRAPLGRRLSRPRKQVPRNSQLARPRG